MSDHNLGQEGTDLLTGRRNFDRQIEVVTIAVHTLQRDFSILEERVRGLQSTTTELSTMIQQLDDDVHKLDKALVTRLATITVTERVLWALAMAVIAIGGQFLGK